MRPSLRALALVVALAALLAHARALGHGFVYDDHRFVERNDAIASLGNVARFFSDPATASAAAGVEPDIYRPLRTLAFAVDRALFGVAPLGWHAASLALHVVNALLVWVFLLRRLAPGRVRGPGAGRLADGAGAGLDAGVLGATAGALLFAVHPVVTESVAWVSSRGDLLAWTFALLALEAFARPSRNATLAGVACAALACLAKESALVLFALAPLAHLSLPRDARPSPRLVLGRTLALAGVTAGYLVLRGAVMPQAKDLTWLAQTDFPGGGRLGAARGFLASVAWYARVLVAPFGFPFDRNVHTDPVPTSFLDPTVVVGAGIVATLVLAGVGAWRRGRPVLATAFLGALVALGPVSNVVVPLKAFAAERFLYPVLPFLALAAGAGVAALARGTSGRRPALVGATAAVVLALGALAFARSAPWRDEASLWKAVQAEDVMNPRAYEGLGFGSLGEGRVDAAERAFRTYREFQPRDGKVRAELAATFARLADDLVPRDASSYEGTNLADRRRFVLQQTILESRAAWDAWSREGVVRARGDAALVRTTLETWRDAALEYGDLAETAYVTAILAEDDRVRTGAVAYAERRVPPLLAGLSLVHQASSSPGGRDDARTRIRAERLTAVGVDPARADVDAASDVVARISATLAERPDDLALRRVRAQVLSLRLMALRGSAPRGDLDLLRADLTALVRAFPRDEALRETLDALEGRQPRRPR